MATRTIKTLGKTGRITWAQAFKAVKEMLGSAPKAKHGQKIPYSCSDSLWQGID